MADVEVSYKGSTIGTLSVSGTLTLETEGKYCEDDLTIDYTAPSGGGGNFTLIGQTTIALQEYTDTSTWENTDTQINVKDTDYAWGYVVITCDSAINSSSEWGMTVSFWGRYPSNGSLYHCGSAMQKGSSTLSKAAMVNATTGSGSYGVCINNNTTNVVISRKCHGTACPKCRGGNYTIKVYGMTAF